MKNITKYLISLAILFIGMMYAGSDLYAVDAPHTTASTNTDCTLCHVPVSASPPAWAVGPYSGDNTMLNGLCNTCHNNPSGTIAFDSEYNGVKTHSAAAIESSKYGTTWTVECTTCHNPHYQRQPRANLQTGYIDGGTITSASTASVITDSTKTWTPDQWQGYVLVPNKAYPTLFYEIKSNSSTTIEVRADQAGMTTRYLGTAMTTSYGIKYGKFVNDVVSGRGVKLLGPSGANSYADGDGTIDGICQVCHTQTEAFNNTGTLFEGSVGSHSTGVAGTNCLSCHNHKDGFKGGGCDACHGYPPISMPTLTKDKDGVVVTSDSAGPGAHSAHKTAGYTCSNCHTGGMTSASSGDNQTNIGFYLYSNLGGTYNGNSGGRTVFPYAAGGTTAIGTGTPNTCSTVYCHSSGQGSTANDATPVYSTPTWTTAGASGACGTCHKVTAASGLTSGSHAAHLNSAVTMGCGDCHTGALNDASDYPSANHVNKLIDAANSYTAGGAAGNGYGTCSAAACHGSGSPTWSNPSAKTGCYRCHGDSANGNAAPGPDTHGDTAATDSQVGAHQAHLTTPSNYSVDVACGECHVVPGTVQASGHINDATAGVAEVLFTDAIVAKYNGASPSYNSGTCSNTYCHGAKMPKSTTNGAGNSPVWTNNNYLTGTASNDCNTCHAYPPSAISQHSGKGPNDCKGCHSDANATGTGFDTVSEHIDGTLQVSGCTGCHGGATGTDGAPKQAADMISTLPLGKHVTHIDTKGYDCDYCHAGHGMSTVIDSKITISFTGIASGGTYSPPAAWQTVPTVKWTYDWAYNAAYSQQCNNLYCHSQGQTVTAPYGGAPNTAATWNGSMPADCTGCHGGNASATGAKMSSNAHAAHMNDGTSMTNKACNTCHNVTVDGTDRAIASQTVHVNQARNVDIINTYDSDATSGNNWASSQCSNVYCHSTGEATPTYKTIAWNTTITNCEACHNYDANATNKMSTGNHTEHIFNAAVIGTNFGCQECHNSTTTNGTSITAPGNHTNKVRDVSMVKGGSWTSPTCSNVYCHSSGQATAAYRTVPNWGSATNLTCDSCHGTEGGTTYGEPAYTNGGAGLASANTHTAHVTSAADCAKCHADTVDAAGTAIKSGSSLHINQSRNVNFASTYDKNGGTNSDNYSAAAKSCSATSCHGTLAPTWGDNRTNDTCVKCHGVLASTPASYTTDSRRASPGYYATSAPTGTGVDTSRVYGTISGGVSNDPQVGAHDAHLRGYGTYGRLVLCSDCHESVVSISTASHMDGTVSLPWSSVTSSNGAYTPTYAGGGGQCSNIYCHGASFSPTSQGTNTRPTWTDGTYLVGSTKNDANCDKCHMSPPATGAHSGKTIADTCAGCHGHEGTGSSHINGALVVPSGCDSCHDYDTTGGGTAWGKGSGSGLTGTTDAWGDHAKHIEYLKSLAPVTTLDAANDTYGGAAFNKVCGVCHSQNKTTDHGPDSTPVSTTRNINFNGSTAHRFGATGPTFNPGPPITCSAVDCHFKATPKW